MEVSKHHMDLFGEIAEREGASEELAKKEVGLWRKRSGMWYRLENHTNIEKLVHAFTQVISAIRNGEAIEVSDYDTGLDIICQNCAATCWKKRRSNKQASNAPAVP